MVSVFLINDGQHRKATIEAAMQEDVTLEKETISIVFLGDEGLLRSQQVFTGSISMRQEHQTRYPHGTMTEMKSLLLLRK